jgi:hypothetical protein
VLRGGHRARHIRESRKAHRTHVADANRKASSFSGVRLMYQRLLYARAPSAETSACLEPAVIRAGSEVTAALRYLKKGRAQGTS